MKTTLYFNAKFLLIAVFAVSPFISCNNYENNDSVSDVKSQDSIAVKDTSNLSTLLSLPAPMQIAAAIKRTNSKFQDAYLSPLKKDYPTDFLKTINLGIYAVDLGYANVYDQKQTSINYFTTALKLADELNIISVKEPGIIKRFSSNVNNEDSVKHYTLSSFANIHNNLLNGNRTNDAYTLLAGSFIEGLSLSCKIYENGKDAKIGQLIGQQKLFLENIMTILSNCTDDKNLVDLTTKLSQLESIYNKVEIKSAVSTDPDIKEISSITISDEVIKEISDFIGAIRTELIK